MTTAGPPRSHPPAPTPAELNQQAWTAAGQWGLDGSMSELETLMWRSERHPELSSTITAVMLLDTAPEWDRLWAAHEWAIGLVRRTRERVQEPVLPVGPPVWVEDSSFTLENHLRRTRLDPAERPGGDMPALLGYTERFALAPLNRKRPLWEAVLVEGLADGRAAYLLKLHHSVTDGLGGVQLLSLVQSRTREHTPDKPSSRAGASPAGINPAVLASRQLASRIGQAPDMLWRSVKFGGTVLSDPLQAGDDAVRFTASLRRMMPPPPAPASPLLKGRKGRNWRFGVLECEFKRLRAAAKAASGSVNDAYIAALLGGLRRYHERHGSPIDALPMAMPVSLRRGDDPMGGNKFAGALLAGPIGVSDPVERIAVIRGTVLTLRTEPALDSFGLLAPWVNMLPSGVGAAAWRLGATADMSASNVPGLPYRSFLAGAQVDRIFAFGPLPGVAIMVAMTTHAGACCIGFNIDGDAVEDVSVLMDCFADGLDEVLAIA
ncbi:wax ester/triacylglycerol synthase domain-containing protein [Nakamurella sp.]|uniref:wax ester/triacylglycerol synthase domain-containing protein n=1 Tax=Nakamurella sp. TaxID=1869182 RepID=UPI0037832D46